MFKRLVMLVSALALLGCSAAAPSSSEVSNGSENEELKLDMSQYSEFEKATVKDLAAAMDNKETFVVYFGFESCPWCYYAVPLLHEVVVSHNQSVMYIDTRANEAWSSNLDIDDYDVVVERLGDYLDYDDNGVKHLYTPHVFFIKDGEVVFDHEGTVEGHKAHETALSKEESAQLLELYEAGIALMQE